MDTGCLRGYLVGVVDEGLPVVSHCDGEGCPYFGSSDVGASIDCEDLGDFGRSKIHTGQQYLHPYS